MFEAPDWMVKKENGLRGQVFDTAETRLGLAIALALENVKAGGGPFGAAVFDGDGRLVAVGANLVMATGQSDAHAEMVAVSRAQDALKRVRLTGCALASSCEPCAMCAGGVLWSGVSSLEYAAPGEAARALGFDEGDKVPEWAAGLERRGIVVRGPMLPAAERLEPFDLYRRRKGRIY